MPLVSSSMAATTLQSLILRPSHLRTLLHSSALPSNPIRFFISSHSCSLLLRKPRSVSKPFLITAAQHSAQGDDGSQVSSPGKSLIWAKPLLSFVADNFLPIALLSGVALGLANPSLGCLADRYSLSKVSTFGIFIISGLMLRSEEIGAAAEAWPVGTFGLGSILLLTPFFSRLILQFQLRPQEFVTGLAIFSCMPTTLSSGVALTQLAGGNTALALAMTVISNLLGILIALVQILGVASLLKFTNGSLLVVGCLVPFSISKFIADGVGVSVPTKELLQSLILTLLIPLLLGKVLRESFKGVADFVDKNRKLFSMLSAIFLGLVPWIQVSRSRSLLLMVKPATFLVAIGMGVLLHLLLLAFNVLLLQSALAVSGGSKSHFAKTQNAIAFLLVASQKTLPVMVAVVEQLHGTLGESGLLVLPCVAAHLNQIILDSFFVNIWLGKDRSIVNPKVA